MISRSRGEYCAAFSSRCDSATDASRGSISDLDVGVGIDAQRMPLERVPDVRDGRIDDVGGGDPLAIDADARPRRCAPCRGCPGTGASADRARPSRRRPAPARSSAVRSPRRFSTATLIAVSGVRRSWLSDASSVAARSAFCRTSSAASRSREELRALDRDRDDAGNRVERADVERRCDGGEQADRPRPVAQRHDRQPRCRSPTLHVAAVGALVRIELERAARPRQRRVQHVASIETSSLPPW